MMNLSNRKLHRLWSSELSYRVLEVDISVLEEDSLNINYYENPKTYRISIIYEASIS
jgi:hypothetical protein